MAGVRSGTAAGRKTGGGAVAKRKSATKPDSTAGRDRLTRLFSWLDAAIGRLEQRLAAVDSGMTVADHEKDARTMTSLIRVYEKLLLMEARAVDEATCTAKRKQGRADVEERGAGSDEAGARRRELAQRINRLREQAGERGPAGGTG